MEKSFWNSKSQSGTIKSLSNIVLSNLKTLKNETHPSPLEINGEGIITSQLVPIFIVTRFLGRFPVSFKSQSTVGVRFSWSSAGDKVSTSKRVNFVYRASWKDISFILSLLSAILFSFCFIFIICQDGGLNFQLFPANTILPDTLKKLNEQGLISGGKLINWIFYSYEIGFTLQALVEYLIVWYSVPQLAEWLSKWNHIEDQLRNYCSRSDGSCPELNFKKFRNYLMVFYIGIPVVFFGSIIITADFDVNYPVYSLLVAVYCYGTTACNISEDTKGLLMFKTIEVTFSQVRCKVAEKLKEKTLLPSFMEFEFSNNQEIRHWHQVIIAIRKQAELAGKYLATQQLLAIGMSIYFASSALFAFANLIGERGVNELMLVCTFTLMTFIRLIFKITIAARITEEESRLATLIKELEFVEQNKDFQNELKSIYNLLSNRPTEISLNNYVSLNNSLILSVCGQVLTQFVVFMQFQN